MEIKVKAKSSNPQAGELDYGRSVRSGVRGLWRGDLDIYGFVDSMFSSINRGFTRAWNEGMQACGLLPSDITPEEQAILDGEIMTETQYLLNYADAIIEESRANQGKLSPLTLRSDMWANRYSYIRDLARSYACGDQKLEWVMDSHCKEHCMMCLRLSGRVYRASTWNTSGISPRSHLLDCGGFHCCCEFVPTDKPITPGPFPRLF